MAKQDPSAFIGQTFNEMYTIVRPIGTGGMGAVFEATHTRLHNKKYAVKMLHASIAQDAEVFQRFRREAEIATELGHPHIVEVHDFNITPDGAPYMVMEFLDGEDLAARIQKRGPLSLDSMQRILSEVCSGLDAAHQAGIVHRDLKPQNIFLCKRLGRDDFVKLVDFGVSKVRDSASVITRDHTLMGTPFYMSPEQADGLVQQIDSRTDIFALGAIMWEMLVGKMAFEAPTISGAMYKVVHVDPPEVHTIRGDVPPAVSAVVRRALAKSKTDRYATVIELSADFANAVRGIMPAVPPPPMQLVPATMPPRTSVPMTASAQSNDELGRAGTVATPMHGTPQREPTIPPQHQPTSTVNNANGQLVTPGASRSKRGMYVAIGAAVIALGGIGVVIAMHGGSGAKQAAVDPTPTPDPKPTPPDPKPEPVKPDPTPVPEKKIVAATIDAGAPVPAAPETVSVTIASPTGVKTMIYIDGKQVVGPINLKKGAAPVLVEVRAIGYATYRERIVPDQDRTVNANLKALTKEPPTPVFIP